MQTQLLCTFTNNNELESTIENIKNTYSIMFNKIFVLQNLDNKTELICSYNINDKISITNINNIPKNTISVHRKKQTNTLYTINALNYLIEVLNDGVHDKNFNINWENYKQTLLVTTGGEFKKIPTRLLNTINIF